MFGSYSTRLFPLDEGEPTEQGNVPVLNDTSYFCRYFDATPRIEFYYKCVEKAIDVDLPQEADFLESNDLFKDRVESFIEMPDGTINLLFSFLKREDGHLPNHALSNKFKAIKSSAPPIALSAGTRNPAGALNDNTGNKIQVTIDECNIFIHSSKMNI